VNIITVSIDRGHGVVVMGVTPWAIAPLGSLLPHQIHKDLGDLIAIALDQVACRLPNRTSLWLIDAPSKFWFCSATARTRCILPLA